MLQILYNFKINKRTKYTVEKSISTESKMKSTPRVNI